MKVNTFRSISVNQYCLTVNGIIEIHKFNLTNTDWQIYLSQWILAQSKCILTIKMVIDDKSFMYCSG